MLVWLAHPVVIMTMRMIREPQLALFSWLCLVYSSFVSYSPPKEGWILERLPTGWNPFEEVLKSNSYMLFIKVSSMGNSSFFPWDTLETPLKFPWNTQEKNYEGSLKHQVNTFKHPKIFLEHPWNFEILFKYFLLNSYEAPLELFKLKRSKNKKGGRKDANITSTTKAV